MNLLVDIILVLILVKGSILVFIYVDRLNGFVIGIFIVLIVFVMYFMLFKLSVENN